MVTTTPIRFEHHRSALGIGESSPRLSWKTTAPAGWVQVAYEVEIERGGVVETTGRIESRESVLVPWPTTPLSSRESASVRVRVFGGSAESEWSEAASVEVGLLQASDWIAAPVGAGWPEDVESDVRRPPLVRSTFATRGAITSARLYASAHGVFEVEINGQRVGDDILSPGWTVYGERLRYYTYDVTSLIIDGDNAIGSWLGDGWYRGRLGWRGGFRNLFGSDLSLIAQLELRYADGSTQTVATDASWRAAFGPIVHSGLYDGETYDARDEVSGWSSPVLTMRPGQRSPCRRETLPRSFAEGPPVRCTEEIAPLAVLTSPSGARVIDFGQSLRRPHPHRRHRGGRRHRNHCAPPRCPSTASSTCDPCAKRSPPSVHAQPRRPRAMAIPVHDPRFPFC